MHYQTMYNITDLVGVSCTLPKKFGGGGGRLSLVFLFALYEHNSRGRSRSNTGSGATVLQTCILMSACWETPTPHPKDSF